MLRGRIAVVGAGSWGTAMACLLAKKGYSISLWARNQDLATHINRTSYNPYYLKDILLPSTVSATASIHEAIEDSKVVVFAVPSHVVRDTIKRIKEYLTPDMFIVSLTKGIEVGTLKRMSEVINEETESNFHDNITVLSGPNHAEEVSKEIPSATVIAAFQEKEAIKLQNIFMTPYFRVYTNSDIIGVELGGAIKNVIAIAAGISDGLGYGDNTKASLMTRGLAEMTRLGVALGAKPLTFSGLSGVGDLIVTCTSPHSRNRAVGEKIAQGLSIDEIKRETRMVAEGIKTSLAVRRLAEKKGVDMPITVKITEVLYERKDPKVCVKELMSRGATREIL